MWLALAGLDSGGLPHRQIAKTDLMVGFLFLSAILMWCWQGRVKTLAQSALSRLLGI